MSTTPRVRRSRAVAALAAVVIAGTCIQMPVVAQAAPPSPEKTPATVSQAVPADPTLTSLGQNFWLAFPTNVYDGGGIGLRLYLSGAAAGTGTVAIPGVSFSQDFTITPGQVASVDIPFADSVTASDGVQALGIHVTADTDIAVYGVNQEPATSDAYLALPVATLGTRYRALGYQGAQGFSATQLTVVGTSSGTTVTITPQTDLNGHPPGTPFNVSLGVGDVYQLQGANSSEDISGTVIDSSSPVAVFGGAVCADVPATSGACDHLVQQLTPTSAWGSNFVSVRLATRNAGDTYRVLANEDGTDVSVNGTVVATIDAGQLYEAVLPAGLNGPGNQGTFIHTSHPTLVAQYGNGSGYDDSTGDPLMMLVPPAGQYLDHYTFAVPDVPGYTPYTSLVVPTSDIDQVSLDGTLVDSTLFSAIPGSAYSGAQMPLAVGPHTVSAPDAFGIQVYEWGSYDGFGFPGGMALRSIYVDPGAPLTAPDLTSSAAAPNAQSATVTIPSGGSVTLLDGDLPVTQVVLDGVGTYSLDADTGVITFTPLDGYTGSPEPVTYEITDATDRTADATYAPSVTMPDAPSPTDLTADGPAASPPQVSVDVPTNGSVTLLEDGTPVNTVNLPGVGTYTLDPDTGIITFTPSDGFVGTADAVTFRVSDQFGQHGSATFTATVDATAGPTPENLTSTGTGTHAQTATIPFEDNESVTLLDGGLPVDTVAIDNVGTYVLDPDTGIITFTPVLGFWGSPTPATFQVTQGELTGTATYSPLVNRPEAPSAADVTSSGIGTAPQSVTISVPRGGRVTLMNGDLETTQIVFPGVGTYVLDTQTATITFVADGGFSGVATPVTYKVADAYAQSDTGSYTPTVARPAPPVATRIRTHGGPGQVQRSVVSLPPGGTARLVDSTGNLTNTVVVSGEGTYTIRPRTGVLTFIPVGGFTGHGSGVAYRVSDAYGQSSRSRYIPTVTAVVVPPSRLVVTAPGLAKLTAAHPGDVHTSCAVTPGRASGCRVILTARVNGDLTVIGHGTASSSTGHGTHRLAVDVHLNTLGRALALRPGGVRASVSASARIIRTGSSALDSTHTRVVTKVTPIAHAVHFDTSSGALKPQDKIFLKRLRTHLADSRVIVCQGYTDSRGSAASGIVLGLKRAKTACAFLVRGTGLATHAVSYGEARPVATNQTAHGRWLNRRAQIIVRY